MLFSALTRQGHERFSPTGVRGQAFFTGQAFRKRRGCEECLTGLPAASASAIESRPMP